MAAAAAPHIRFADFFFSDANGVPHVMEESIDNVPEHLDGGLSVDGSSVAALASVDRSDVVLLPDVTRTEAGATAPKRTFELEGELIDMYMCTVYGRDGKPHPGCPRAALQRAVEHADALGLKCEMFSELEFFLVKEDGEPMDHGHYLDMPPLDGALRFRRELCHLFESAGIRVKRLHHECGPGQHEVELQLQPVVKNCDDTVLGMFLTRMLARKYGWRATFSPKVDLKIAGSGLHEHVRILFKDGSNAFAAPDGGLNERAMQFVAGLLKYGRHVASVFCRSKHSFERLVPGHEAPTYATWGFAARNALVRIPQISRLHPEKTRCEFRAGDSSGSPHLLCAMILEAGLRGIEEHLACPPEPTMNLDSIPLERVRELGFEVMPHSWEEVQELLRTSPLVKDIIGDHLQAFLLKGHHEEVV